MKTSINLTTLALLTFLSLGITDAAFAAQNTAIDGAGPGFALADSDPIDITALGQPKLMKAVYSGGTCVASSDGTCGALTNANIPSNTQVTFVIYVANASSITLNDIRFNDTLSTASPGGFTYVANTLSYGSAVAAGSWANAYANAFNNNLGIYDTSANTDPLYFDDTGSPTVIRVGGDGLVGNNQTVNVAPGNIFAIAFDVTVNP
ncbi:MAG: hypothetical protein ABFQ82_01405 [Thermodesulfobacteriota bacterium]